MAKIPRKQIFPFASGASNNGVFGSAQAGTKITTTDIEAIQGISGDAPSTAYTAGWLDAVISGQNLPPLEEMQGLQYVFSTELSYLFQEGIPEYYTLTNYFQNSIVKKPGTYQLYGSLIDNNQGNALPSAVSNTNWQYLGDLSGLGSNSRQALAANTNFYVSTTGSDSNPGTSGSPWQTINHATQYVANSLDPRGFTVTINIANGTYTENAVVYSLLNNEILNIIGNNTTPGNVIIHPTTGDAMTLAGVSSANISGFQLNAGTGGSCLTITQQANLQTMNKMIFGAADNYQIFLTENSTIGISPANTYTIAGSAQNHFFVRQNSTLYGVGSVVTLIGTPAFANGFINVDTNASAIMTGATYSGSATGLRYAVSVNGSIVCGGSTSFFPGNSNGTPATGGQYV